MVPHAERNKEHPCVVKSYKTTASPEGAEVTNKNKWESTCTGD
jgi:hypothetical protein